MIIFHEGAIASWNQNVDERAKKPPRPDLFLAIYGGDTGGYGGGTNSRVGHGAVYLGDGCEPEPKGLFWWLKMV